jgi:hypothetical protein
MLVDDIFDAGGTFAYGYVTVLNDWSGSNFGEVFEGLRREEWVSSV